MINRKPMGTVAYVGQGPFPEPFVRSWGQLIAFTTQHVDTASSYVHWEHGAFSGQEDTRNILAERFLGDWLLQLDSDHAFEPDLVQRMLRLFEGYDLDVLTGLYQYRTPPYHFVIYKWYNEGGYKYIVPGDLKFNSPPFEVDCAGAGTLMIRRRVFERIGRELGEKPFTRWYPWSEDFSFFQRMMRLSEPKPRTWCAPAVRTFHLRTVEVQPSDYDAGGLHIVKQLEVPTLEQPICLPTIAGASPQPSPTS